MAITLEDLARAKSDVREIFESLRYSAKQYAKADTDCRSQKDIESVFNGIDEAADLLESFPEDMRRTEQ